jgi:hypothetical protein
LVGLRQTARGKAEELGQDEQSSSGLGAWKAVNALIEDAKAEFKGERREAFAWAI